MIQRLATMAPIAFLILLAGASFWLERTVRSSAPENKVERHDPDFWAENFTVRKFGPDGKLQNTLTATKMLHYPDDDTTAVTKPNMRYHRNPPVVLSSETGLISADGEEVVLIGRARVTRETAEATPATQIDTRVLRLFPDEERAVSRDPVTITQGQSIIKGSGMESNNKTGISVISGRVTGIIHNKP